MLYQKLAKPVLFRMEPEYVHNVMLRTGNLLGRTPLRHVLGAGMRHEEKSLATEVCGIRFRNPIGLAAGFDKNAQLTGVLPFIGFGFEEVGSVTGRPWPGNPRPRLFRLPKDKSLIVNFGLSSRGSETIRGKLQGRRFRFPLGVSIAGIQRERTVASAIEDYLLAFRNLHALGDYTTLNVSCPNLAEGQTFCRPANLRALLKALSSEDVERPIFLKLKPDFTREEMDNVIRVVKKSGIVSGVIIGNLTKDRGSLKTGRQLLAEMPGGLSGRPTREKSNEWIQYAYRKTRGSIPIIGCGGIFTPDDAWKKISLGASLLQIITGMVYHGPGFIRSLKKGLASRLREEGYSGVADAVGTAV